MFKSWSKKKKFKAIFQLQFEATQVPKLKKPALMLALVPDDVGRPTVKLGKSPVQDGTCIWENPVYEPVKLIEESKTGKLKEKIYHFIVSTGTSKAGYLGEASIDFADLVAETEPLTVTLPLKFANSGIVLQVTVHRIQDDADKREIEENDDPTLSRHSSADNQNSIWDTDGSNHISNGDAASSQNGKAGDTTRKTHVHQKSSLDWSSDGSLFDSPNRVEEMVSTERVQSASDDSIETLRNEIGDLKRQVALSELELQSLRKQMVKETKQGQNLSRQISSLKVDRDALQTECEQLKSSQGLSDGEQAFKKLQPESKDTRLQLEAMKQELSYEKRLRTNLHSQLQTTLDSNSELVLEVKDLEGALGKKNREISDLSSKLETSKNSKVMGNYSAGKVNEEENQRSLEKLAKKHNDAHAKELESLKLEIRDLLSEIDAHKKEREEQEMHIKQLTLEYDLLKKDNHGISLKLDRNQERLRTEMENERAGYMATIRELESQLERSVETIEKQAHEFSECLISIQELESEVKSLEMELEMQANGFEDKLEAIVRDKVEQEQKAIQAEEALKKARWNSSTTAERLQEEFKMLSVEMKSKVDEKENQATKALAEANELRQQNRILEDMFRKANEEMELMKGQNEVKLLDLVKQINLQAKHIEKMSMELENKSKHLETVQKRKEEEHEAQSMNNQILKIEIERLTEENSNFTVQEAKKLRDLEQMKKLISENEMLIQSLNVEKDNLEKKFTSAKQEAQKTHQKLTNMISLKDEKETTITYLKSEVENLRSQHREFKDTLSKEALTKESLKKHVLQLKSEVHKKVSTTKKLKNYNGQGAISEKSITSSNLPRKVEDCSDKELNNHTDLLAELTLLKERNKSMENELKEMEERYSEISLKFAEVEGERQQLVMTVRNLRNSKKN